MVFVKTKLYDKRDYFDFDIVNFPYLDILWFYISQLIRLHVDDFNTRKKRFWQQNLSNNNTDIVYFVSRFQNFIGFFST